MCLLWITKKLQLIEKYFSDTSTARLWSLLSVRKDSLVWNYRAIYSGYIGFCLISISLQTKKLQRFEIYRFCAWVASRTVSYINVFFENMLLRRQNFDFNFLGHFCTDFKNFFFKMHLLFENYPFETFSQRLGAFQTSNQEKRVSKYTRLSTLNNSTFT